LTRLDKVLLGFTALALSSAQSVQPPVAKVVHGSGRNMLRVKAEPLVGEARKGMAAIRAA